VTVRLDRHPVVIAGVAETPLGNVTDQTELSMVALAAREALAEAGLTLRDVDGIFVNYLGEEGSVQVGEYLGIQPRYADSSDLGGAAFEAFVHHAMLAVAAGRCEVALITYASRQRSRRGRSSVPLQDPRSLMSQFETPYGMPVPLGQYALVAARHMHQYGTTSEQLAEIAVAARAWAAKNPKAWSREPLTVAEVLASKPICDPLRKLDCCLITDGGGAVVVTTAERARDAAKRAIRILGAGESHTHWHIAQMPDLTTTATRLSGAEAMARFTVLGTTRDRSGRLWISVGGSGVFFSGRFRVDLQAILEGRPDMAPGSLDADQRGRVWLVYRDELAMVEGDRVRVYTAADGLEVGSLMSVRADGERVWVSGERGFALLHGDRFQPVNASPGSNLALGVVTGTVPTSNGLWLTTTTGIGHVAAGEVERLSVDPAARIRVELFDLVSDLPDPLRYVARPFRWATEAGDGVLWFVTQGGVAKVDPRQVVRNPLPPPVAFRAVIADDSSFAPHGEIELPPLTRTLRIEYTAVSLAIPERVRFRHRLEGWEGGWHDAGDRREVTYTDIGPGRYALHVTASNNDGVWNETGATLNFTVAPTWFQTTLFRLAVAALLLGLLAAAYRIRVRRVSAVLAARYDERLAERTRIARELHDTLLQTVQGSKIVADDALDRPDDPDRLRHALTRVSEWLGQASQEGRAALNSLRGSEAVSDLADALRRAADNPARPTTMSVSVEAHCAPKILHPVVQEEIYRIGYEGIQNACRHSRATRLAIEIEYGNDLVLRMTDDGVGLDPAVAGAGKPGHFGIPGMRERATDIGAALTVEPANPGTRITLVVPGRRVFRAGATQARSY